MSEAEGTTEIDCTADGGRLLRVAREAQGLHIAALAVALKVPVKKLEALEAGHYSELPDVAFVRSLAMSICRALKIDPTEILAALPGLPVPNIKPAGNVSNTEFKNDSSSAQASIRAQLSSPFGMGIAALLLLTVVIWLWRDQSSKPSFDVTAEQNQMAAPASPLQSPVLPDPLVQAVPPAPDASAPVVIGVLHDAEQPAVLEIKARGVSWIDVTDADGVTQLRKLTTDGEILRLAGKLPLSVIVGRADLIDASVRGQALDLVPLARDNVARFEVK